MSKRILIALSAIVLVFGLASCDLIFPPVNDGGDASGATGNLYEVRNDDKPYFTAEDYAYAESYVASHDVVYELSPLDDSGRVGVCWGLFDQEHMPDYEREDLDTKPTGWIQKEYDSSIVPGGWLYARAHLLAFQLSGLQDDPRNLMTGTREFNNEGMLPFENMVADHLKDSPDHKVLYRVTPEFGDGNLLAYGVLIESDCLDCDDMADFCVFVRNQQPGIILDYSTGDSWLDGENPPVEDEILLDEATYILNSNSKKIHNVGESCAPAPTSKNYQLTDLSFDELLAMDYEPCGTCKPTADSAHQPVLPAA